MTVRRTPEERAALRRAKATLDQLDFYPKPVDIRHVRILHVPWLFRLPWFRRFHGYEMGPLILIKRPLHECTPGLIAHELCHVWQDQDHRLRMWWSYLRDGYATTGTRSRPAGPAPRPCDPHGRIHAHRDRHRPRLPAGLTRPARGA